MMSTPHTMDIAQCALTPALRPALDEHEIEMVQEADVDVVDGYVIPLSTIYLFFYSLTTLYSEVITITIASSL